MSAASWLQATDFECQKSLLNMKARCSHSPKLHVHHIIVNVKIAKYMDYHTTFVVILLSPFSSLVSQNQMSVSSGCLEYR